MRMMAIACLSVSVSAQVCISMAVGRLGRRGPTEGLEGFLDLLCRVVLRGDDRHPYHGAEVDGTQDSLCIVVSVAGVGNTCK